METRNFTTAWGTTMPAFYRDGKNDYNTLLSILQEDEYNIVPIMAKAKVSAAIDLGSHIGGFTLAAAAHGLRTVSVECLPENIAVQQASVDANGFNLVTIVHGAIGKTTGKTATVSYADTGTESGAHHEFVGGSVTHAGGRSIEVPTINLITILATHLTDVKGILVKTDCEGAEWEAFKGLPNAVLDRIDWIVGEVHAVGEYKNKGDLLTMVRNKFDDVSADFHTFDVDPGLATFVFKRKGL